jgi:hypothetical protein
MLKTEISLDGRMETWDWPAIEQNLDEAGYAKIPGLLAPEECARLIELYSNDSLFRNRVDMAQYRFGQGEYKYFSYELPPLVQELRSAFYPHLVGVANGWNEKLGLPGVYPASLADFLDYCHFQGQPKPTPLVLKYDAGGYNCLHQDLYGAVAFPFQVVFALSQRGTDYEGGELLLVEQRPRAQSIGQVITLEKGQGLIFTNRYRPVASSRGYYRANVRHGVSKLQQGTRYSLGIIFHDAQ